jgi:hypothetical protein
MREQSDTSFDTELGELVLSRSWLPQPLAMANHLQRHRTRRRIFHVVVELCDPGFDPVSNAAS